MQAVLPFPEISPEIVSVTIFGLELALRWYALAYIVGILIGWRLVVMAVNRPRLWPHGEAPMTAEQVEELLTWVILGVIIGGRLGFVFFYKPAYYLENPLEIPMIWQGGMAFHGGLLGRDHRGRRLLSAQRHPDAQRGRCAGAGGPAGDPAGAHREFHQRRAMGSPQ